MSTKLHLKNIYEFRIPSISFRFGLTLPTQKNLEDFPKRLNRFAYIKHDSIRIAGSGRTFGVLARTKCCPRDPTQPELEFQVKPICLEAPKNWMSKYASTKAKNRRISKQSISCAL